jgi:hypothetical protein
MIYFLINMTNEIEMIVAFSFFFVDVFLIFFFLRVVFEEFSFLIFFVIFVFFIRRFLKIVWAIAWRRRCVDEFFHIVLQTTNQDQQFFFRDWQILIIDQNWFQFRFELDEKMNYSLRFRVWNQLIFEIIKINIKNLHQLLFSLFDVDKKLRMMKMTINRILDEIKQMFAIFFERIFMIRVFFFETILDILEFSR